MTDAVVGAGTAGLVKGGGAVVSNIAKKAAPKVANAVGKIRSLSSEKIFQKQYKQLGQAARKANPCNCFGKGTLVWTATGLRAIEELRVGDQVLSWNEETGEIALKTVTETFVTPDRPLLDLAVTGATTTEVITTTPGHPFWVEGTGWVHAADLTTGDALRLVANGPGQPRTEMGAVRNLSGAADNAPPRGTVYNLTVADFHTYFVGARGVLVHNASPCWSRAPKSIQDRMTLEAAQRGEGNRIIKDLGDPRFQGMEKWELKVKSADGRDSVVHYVRDPETGNLMDFKFKKHSTEGSSIWASKPDPKVSPGGT